MGNAAKRKILILCQQEKGITPGQRFRIEQYLSFLEENNYEIEFSSLMKHSDNKYLYSAGFFIRKFIILVKSIFIRIYDLIRVKSNEFDAVFIYRDALMIGSVFFERQISKTSVPIIYDFDDAIWLNDVSDGNRKLAWLKNPDKTTKIIKYSTLVTVGNQFLANFAKSINSNTVIIPTTIDTNYHIPINKEIIKEKICIGWTGSITTVKHFNYLIPVLKKLLAVYPHIEYKLIGDPNFENKELGIKGIEWKIETEIFDLQQIDIGIMPLPDDEWSRGKCGFKALQYMALEIPCVISPHGVNSDIVRDGVNGFLADNEHEWFEKISMLIENKQLRLTLGRAGRQTIIAKYSVEANKMKWKEAFDVVVNKQYVR